MIPADMSYIVYVLIVVLASIGAGVLAGNGAVYAFNRLPARWLCDYGQEPSPELLSRDTQRVKSWPWKYVFTATFIIIGIYMAMMNWQYAAPAFIACWLLLLIAIADRKYMIVPDQLVLLLAVTGIGFIPFRGSYLTLVWGALLGAAAMLAVVLLGRLIWKKSVMGFGDVKLSAALGLAAGYRGIAVILITAAFASGAVLAVMLIRRKIKMTDSVPLGPYICAAGAAYLIVLHQFF